MASGTDKKLIKVKVKYMDTPPQIFVSQMNSFIRDHQPPRGFRVEISWERVISREELELEQQQMSVPRDLPLGYRLLSDAPVHCGPNYCRYCLCAPCIIQKPPEFLRGSCDAHPANAEKRHMLYRKFWQCLKALGVWQDEEYLQRKEVRTTRDDKRDIIPDCVIQEIRRRYPSDDGHYRDYFSTFDVNREVRSYESKFKATNIPRYHELVAKEEQVKGVPGPGQYNVKSQFKEGFSSSGTCDSEFEKAPFGSHLQRFLTEKQHSPASTTYQDPRTAFATIHRLHGIKQTPFSQSSKRFKSNLSDYPGPGTYNNNYATGMTSQLMRRVMSDGHNKTPFGSTSVRTIPLTKKDELHFPGPADYQDNMVESPRYKNRTHVFASTTKRLYSPVTDNPPPGLYEVAKVQGKLDVSSIRSGFLSTSERFAPPRDVLTEGPDIYNPGPAEYQIADQRKQPGGVICSEVPRFKEPKKAATPGPGTYSLSKSQRDTLLQGTYNVKLLNPLVEDRNINAAIKQKKSVLISV